MNEDEPIMQTNSPYVLTLSQVVEKVESLQFSPMLGGTTEHLKEAKKLVPIPSLMEYVGLPMAKNQPCWFCPPDTHKGERSLSVYQHRDYGYWLIKSSCGQLGDVTDLWEWLVPLCLGHLPVPWDKYAAALDLLTRRERRLST